MSLEKSNHDKGTAIQVGEVMCMKLHGEEGAEWGLNLGLPALYQSFMSSELYWALGKHTKEVQQLVLALREEGSRTHHGVSDTPSGVKAWWWQCQCERPRTGGKMETEGHVDHGHTTERAEVSGARLSVQMVGGF